MQELQGEIDDPWEDPEAIEALRNYIEVSWRIFEKREAQELEEKRSKAKKLLESIDEVL